MILGEIKNMYFPALQQIEYLESTGTQYIDTGIVPSETFYSASLIVDTQFTDLTQRQLFGSTDAFYFGVNNGSWEMHYEIHKNYADTYRHVISKEIQKSTLQLIFNLDNAYTDSRPYSAIVENNLYKNTAYLFALNEDNNAICMCKCRLYGAKIYIDDVLVRDFIPVRVGNVGYMYDKVTKQLFGNAGTGNFVLGQDVDLILQQIYQNRLIEGVDYETYDWLEGRNGAYINTNHKLITIDDAFEVHARYDKTLRNDLNQEQEVFGFSTGRNTGIDNLYVRVYIYSSNGFNANYFWHHANKGNWGGKNHVVNMDGDVVIKLSADENNYYVSYDDVQVTQTSELERDTYGDIYLFNENDDMLTGHFNGGISYFRITDSTFVTDKLYLIPCQLLHSIPRNLDAQCKERVAGECGMVDLISGKFYGNVANSGTFTVENDNNE